MSKVSEDWNGCFELMEDTSSSSHELFHVVPSFRTVQRSETVYFVSAISSKFNIVEMLCLTQLGEAERANMFGAYGSQHKLVIDSTCSLQLHSHVKRTQSEVSRARKRVFRDALVYYLTFITIVSHEHLVIAEDEELRIQQIITAKETLLGNVRNTALYYMGLWKTAPCNPMRTQNAGPGRCSPYTVPVRRQIAATREW